MRCRFAIAVAAAGLCLSAAVQEDGGLPVPGLAVQVDDPGQWSLALSSLGLKATRAPCRFRIVTADSPAARQAGFRPTERRVRVVSVVEERDADLRVVWKEPLEIPVFSVPEQAQVFVREKRTGAPLLAGVRRPNGGLLWAAVGPGPNGYDRFPYLMQALVDLGLTPPFRAAETWAFFDYSYRTRVDLDYMARRWRRAGIAALHASAWPFHESDPQRDGYLQDLIRACHREGVLVYAWLELPHVSEDFWQNYPHCREKTAVLQDAHLDWRKLINLADPECRDKVAKGVDNLLARFEWDGVNLAELYFESLHGPSNPQRFTPMNSWVRSDFQQRAGFDPLALFDPQSPYFWSRNRAAWSRFAGYRAELALELQEYFLRAIRKTSPQLDLVATQIDDLFDTRMREHLGADAAALLPLTERYDFSLVVEDPATLWLLGPDRYREIAERYRALTPDPARLAIDINIVERYQQTYPTKKQVGIELFQLLRTAGHAFSRVLLYSEHSISRSDWDLLPYAAAVAQADVEGESLVVQAERPVGLNWPAPAEVNGQAWPAADGSTVWLPAGRHVLRRGKAFPALRLLFLNAELLGARSSSEGLEFEYSSRSRAIALLSRQPAKVQIDGRRREVLLLQGKEHTAVLLPAGRHRVLIPSGV